MAGPTLRSREGSRLTFDGVVDGESAPYIWPYFNPDSMYASVIEAWEVQQPEGCNIQIDMNNLPLFETTATEECREHIGNEQSRPMGGIPGVSADEPTTVNERGGKQSATPYRFDLFPPHAMFDVAGVLGEGALKYGGWNWERISTEDNLNHALQHIYAYLAGDESDEHLSHAICRCLFAATTSKIEKGIIEPHKIEDN